MGGTGGASSSRRIWLLEVCSIVELIVKVSISLFLSVFLMLIPCISAVCTHLLLFISAFIKKSED